MSKFSKYVLFAVFVSLVSLLVASFAAPFLIKVLFTPPVSFGTNCEPAADWAMGKLLLSQAVMGIGGFVLGLAVFGWFRRGKKQPSENPTTSK
jgi:hypothetical protein